DGGSRLVSRDHRTLEWSAADEPLRSLRAPRGRLRFLSRSRALAPGTHRFGAAVARCRPAPPGSGETATLQHHHVANPRPPLRARPAVAIVAALGRVSSGPRRAA